MRKKKISPEEELAIKEINERLDKIKVDLDSTSISIMAEAVRRFDDMKKETKNGEIFEGINNQAAIEGIQDVYYGLNELAEEKRLTIDAGREQAAA